MIIHRGNLTVDLDKGIVKVDANKIYLTDVEYKFLAYMVERNYVNWILANELIYDFAGEVEEKDKHAFTVSKCIIGIVNKLKDYKSIYNLVTSYNGLRFDIFKFDESSKEIQEKEELIDELRYQIRRDMEDYKLTCSRIPNFIGDEYIRIFGDEEHYSFFRLYLMNKIKKNIIKIRDINKC